MLAVVSGVSPAGLAMLPRASLAKRSVAVWTASSDKTLGDVACAYVCARVLTHVCRLLAGQQSGEEGARACRR